MFRKGNNLRMVESHVSIHPKYTAKVVALYGGWLLMRGQTTQQDNTRDL